MSKELTWGGCKISNKGMYRLSLIARSPPLLSGFSVDIEKIIIRPEVKYPFIN